jgi:hypothetical protein
LRASRHPARFILGTTRLTSSLLGFGPPGCLVRACARNGFLCVAVRRLSARLFVVRLPLVAFAIDSVLIVPQ